MHKSRRNSVVDPWAPIVQFQQGSTFCKFYLFTHLYHLLPAPTTHTHTHNFFLEYLKKYQTLHPFPHKIFYLRLINMTSKI